MPIFFGRTHRLFNRGLKEASRHRWAEAIESYRAALDLAPGDSRLLLQYGAALSEAGSYPEALSAFQKALFRGAPKAAAAIFSARACLDHGRPAEAEEALREAVALDPANFLAADLLALARWDLGHQEEAAKTLLDLNFLQSPSFESRLLQRLEEFFMTRPGGPFPEPAENSAFAGARWFTRAKLRRTKRLLGRAGACLDQGRTLKGLALYEAARNRSPEDRSIRKDLARVRGRLIEALEKEGRKKKVLLLDLELGGLHFENRLYKPAAERLEKWLEASEKEKAKKPWLEEIALRMLAESALALGDRKKAEERVEALRKFPTVDGYFFYFEGSSLLRAGKKSEARLAFERFLAREPAFARSRLRTWMQAVENRDAGR